ncbi:MAG: SPOR domain-containing protein [Granulosicoccus sp.]
MSAYDALDPDHSGQLSDAALLALQLYHQPFGSLLRDASASLEDNPDAAALPFSDAVTEEQLADIKQALITGDDLLLILGARGSGKSTLVQQLSANSGLRIQCFSVSGSERFSTLNLFAGMLEAFQQKPSRKLKDVLDELTPCLQSMAARNTLCVVVLDDAHKVNQTELTQLLSGMMYMNSQDETLVRVAFAATSDFEDQIPDLLPEGADMPYSSLTIEGFSPQRAAAYLDYRLGLAGFDQEFPFSDRDMASLVDHSDGLPAELHALTADVLNEKYGRLEENVPHELLSDNGEGFLASRKGKFALGIVATVLILGGLLMFLPNGERQNRTGQPERIDVAEQSVATEPQAPLVTLNNSQSTISANNQTQTEADVNDTTNTGSSETRSEQISFEPAMPDSAPDNTEALQAPVADEAAALAASRDTPTIPSPADSSTSEQSENPGESASATAISESADNTDTETVDVSAETTAETTADNTSPPPESAANGNADDQNTAPEQAAENQLANDTATDNNTDTAALTDTTNTPSDSLISPELEELLESPNWVLIQDDAQYTVQMSASRDLASVENFLRRNTLPRPNSIFSFEREGEIWYALVHGIFPTFSEAQRAVETMSDSAQRDQPWIRSISRVKEILRQE